MHELLPIVLGAVLGAATVRLANDRLRLLVRIVAAVAIGVIAVIVAAEGPLLVLWDAAQAFVAAIAVGALLRRAGAVAPRRPPG